MKQIKRIQIKDYAADILRNKILCGDILPGEELAQETIAEQLGVSRMPVREALQELEREGFVKKLPNRHMQVCTLSETEIRLTFRVISAMEAELCLLVSENGIHIGRLLEPPEGGSKREKELGFHYSLLEQVSSEYIQSLLIHMLDGLVSFVVMELDYETDAYQKLVQIVSEIYQNKSRVKPLFDEYYAILAARLIAYRRGIANE